MSFGSVYRRFGLTVGALYSYTLRMSSWLEMMRPPLMTFRAKWGNQPIRLDPSFSTNSIGTVVALQILSRVKQIQVWQ